MWTWLLDQHQAARAAAVLALNLRVVHPRRGVGACRALPVPAGPVHPGTHCLVHEGGYVLPVNIEYADPHGTGLRHREFDGCHGIERIGERLLDAGTGRHGHAADRLDAADRIDVVDPDVVEVDALGEDADLARTAAPAAVKRLLVPEPEGDPDVAGPWRDPGAGNVRIE